VLRPSFAGVLLVLAGALGCGDSTGPRAGALSGRWVGAPGNFYRLTFTLVHEDSVLTGHGTVDAEPRQRIAVIGRASASGDVNLTVASENIIPFVFLGTAAADGRTMSGRFSAGLGTGLPVDTVTFHRE
jgi:hypothetical protein